MRKLILASILTISLASLAAAATSIKFTGVTNGTSHYSVAKVAGGYFIRVSAIEVTSAGVKTESLYEYKFPEEIAPVFPFAGAALVKTTTRTI